MRTLNKTIALYFIAVLGLITLLLCTEDSRVFSFSIAMICTMTGLLISQCIKKKITAPKEVAWKIIELFLACLVVSIGIQQGVENDTYRITFIVLVNIIIGIGAITYLLTYKKS